MHSTASETGVLNECVRGVGTMGEACLFVVARKRRVTMHAQGEVRRDLSASKHKGAKLKRAAAMHALQTDHRGDNIYILSLVSALRVTVLCSVTSSVFRC